MDKTYLGRSIEDFAPGIESKPITKVELLDENGDIVGVAGTDSGKTLTAQNPDGTNAMAQAILAKVSGYTHIGYEGQNAMIDPAAEIGDAVTVTGHYVPIVSTDSTFDSLLAVNISAPDADELDDEYPYKSKTQRQIERNMAVTRSLITKTSEEINLEIQGVDGRVSSLQLTMDGVTITGADGVTRIKGGSVDATTIRTGDLNLTGVIEWADLSATAQARVDSGKGGDPNPSYIHSTYISQTKVISPHIYGGDLYATGQGNTSGTSPAFYMSDGVTGTGANTTPNSPRGWLCYDKNGAGTTQEAQNRVFLHSVDGVAMKLEAGGNMSLEANDSIYLRSHLKLRSGINYGTAAQRDAITPENGQIFWVVS